MPLQEFNGCRSRNAAEKSAGEKTHRFRKKDLHINKPSANFKGGKRSHEFAEGKENAWTTASEATRYSKANNSLDSTLSTSWSPSWHGTPIRDSSSSNVFDFENLSLALPSLSAPLAPISYEDDFSYSANIDQAPTGASGVTTDTSSFNMKGMVLSPGYLSFQLRNGITVNIGPNYALQIINAAQNVRLVLSGCGTQMALVHPQGRVLQYNARIEVHSRGGRHGHHVEKNAKIWPKGISFTASNCAIVYLVDTAGTRSTSDFFHDLYSEDSTDGIFAKSCQMYNDLYAAQVEDPDTLVTTQCIQMLEDVKYWTNEKADFWQIDDSCIIQQTTDGYVSVDRKYGNELFTLKTSPSNGRARLQSSFIYVTASLGAEAHLFVKSKDRRIHHSEKAFTVRNAGHAAGFDETDSLRIY